MSDPGKRIHHLAASLVPGDAVSDCAAMLHAVAVAAGWRSTMYADHRAGPFATAASPTTALTRATAPGDVLVYHHSTGAAAADAFVTSRDVVRIMVYHNITPPALLAGLPAAAARSAHGLAQLPAVVGAAELCVAVSGFNADGLRAAHARRVEVVPLAVDDARRASLGLAADRCAGPATAGSGTAARFLHVGRIVPSKRLELAVRAVEYAARQMGGRGVLTLVGDDTSAPDYVRSLVQFAAGHPSMILRVAGKLDEAGLVDAYSNADLYICPSAHEGFCVPLVECMFAELPVVALDAGAIADTLGGAGMVVGGADSVDLAEAALAVLRDAALRDALRSRQRVRRIRFTRESFASVWPRLLADPTASGQDAVPQGGG